MESGDSGRQTQGNQGTQTGRRRVASANIDGNQDNRGGESGQQTQGKQGNQTGRRMGSMPVNAGKQVATLRPILFRFKMFSKYVLQLDTCRPILFGLKMFTKVVLQVDTFRPILFRFKWAVGHLLALLGKQKKGHHGNVSRYIFKRGAAAHPVGQRIARSWRRYACRRVYQTMEITTSI